MQASTILGSRSSGQSNNEHISWAPARQNFFQKHEVGRVVGGLVMSSLLWGLLAFGVYAVYSLVLGTD